MRSRCPALIHGIDPSVQTYPNIAACYAELFPEARRLYVSPDIAASAAAGGKCT